MSYDLHKAKSKLKRELEKLENSNICKRNRELIIKFQHDLIAEGVKLLRVIKYISTLRLMCERWNGKEFDTWNENDLKEILFKIETSEFTTSTVNEYRKTLRRFFRWLKGEDWKPLKILKGDKRENKKPEVLTEDEIFRMIEAAKHPRDKALIALGYEAGLRVSELAGIKWKDIEWDDNLTKVKVRGKTGERKLPIVIAAKYLREWMKCHPSYDGTDVDSDAYVFVNIGSPRYGQPMEYRMINKIIKKAAKNAGIKKRVYPYILRHSRATILANYLTEHQMNVFFGWVQGSDMPRTYVHLSGRDIDAAMKKVYGINDGAEEPKIAIPKKCPRCGYLNSPTDKFCGRCGLILDEKERIKLQMEENKIVSKLIEEIFENPELVEKFKKMLKIVDLLEQNPEITKALLSRIS